MVANSPLLQQLKCVIMLALGTVPICTTAISLSPADEPQLKSTSEFYASEYGSYGPSRQTGHRPSYAIDGEYRQPVDIVFVDAHSALVTTKLSGELYELQWSPTNFKQSFLSRVYRDPACSWGTAIVLAPNLVAVTECHAEQVVLFERTDLGWHPVARFETPGQAHSLAWDADRRLLIASGQWSQQLYRWQCDDQELNPQSSWLELPPVDLHMCGGELLRLPKHNLLLVTDAFGRNYRLLDSDTGDIVKSERVYGHNITGLASVHDETMVLFPHQLLSETAQSVQNEITWGGLLSNNLRWLRIDRMRDHSGHDIFRTGRFYPLGTNGDGCGDPSSLAVSSTGLLAITLGGTNRVAIGTEDDYYFRQFDVGYHPTSCQFSPDERALIVVNQFSDSLSIVGLSDDQVHHLSLGELRPPTQVERGEQAFFNSRLSHDGWMSCHSCHSQGHTSGQLNDNFTDHSYGTPKRILSLLGQAETAPYSWSGAITDLESQIAHSIHSTMAGDRPASNSTIADIAAYIRSLPAPPSRTAARTRKSERGAHPMTGDAVDSDASAPNQGEVVRSAGHDAGGELFRSLGCADCHGGRWLTTPETYDVGLVDEATQRLFNPPSLIGVSQREDVLLHDGRAGSLRDLLEHHAHQLPHALSAVEIDTLVEYLERL